MSVKYLSRKSYSERAVEIGKGHWKNAHRRWVYHGAAVAFAQIVAPSSAASVLEMGTMGISCIEGSHTIDYLDSWDFQGKAPTYAHDARKTPWPVETDTYKLLIALRVYHHLAPVQREAFNEARRVARNLIICSPESYDKVKGSRGIPLESYIEWNDGREPTAIMEIDEEFGNLYFWNEKALRGRVT